MTVNLWLLLVLLLLLLLLLWLLLLLLLCRRSVMLLPCRVWCLLLRWDTSASRVSIPGTLVTLPMITLTSNFPRLHRHLFFGQHRIIPGQLLALARVSTRSMVCTLMW